MACWASVKSSANVKAWSAKAAPGRPVFRKPYPGARCWSWARRSSAAAAGSAAYPRNPDALKAGEKCLKVSDATYVVPESVLCTLYCYKINSFFLEVFFERFLPLNSVSRVFSTDTCSEAWMPNR